MTKGKTLVTKGRILVTLCDQGKTLANMPQIEKQKHIGWAKPKQLPADNNAFSNIRKKAAIQQSFGIFTFDIISCFKFHLNNQCNFPVLLHTEFFYSLRFQHIQGIHIWTTSTEPLQSMLFQMKEYIFTLFLLIVALTFHGTGAKCLQNDAFCRQCDTICRARGREGRNCCFGTQGGYRKAPHGIQEANFDIYNTCWKGTCDLSGILGEGNTCQHCLR